MELEGKRKGIDYIDFLAQELKEGELKKLKKTINSWPETSFFPKKEKLFAAFKYHHLADLKVVIVGQDPYKDEAAEGLAFSCFQNRIKPSLINIFRVLKSTHPQLKLKSTSLIKWARQGVLLLNTALTTPAQQGVYHHQLWDSFTERLFKFIDYHCEGIIFLFLGSSAKRFAANVNKQKHHLIFLSHPSPLSAHISFLGSAIFERIDRILASQGKRVDWET